MNTLNECQYLALLTAADNYSVETFHTSPSRFTGLKVEDLSPQPPLH